MPRLVTTTAIAILGPTTIPCSFIIHADADNADTINISGTDPLVLSDFEELLPGQSIAFDDFVGTVWAISEAGTLNYSIPFIRYGKGLIQK